jgi:hypothetical protein
MVTHMKTTVEIPDSLFKEAKNLAAMEGTTLKALVSEGLRRIVAERQKKEAFKLRKATFRGQGMQPHLADASWDQLGDLAIQRNPLLI